MEMADPMRDRNRRERAQRGCPSLIVAVRPEYRPCRTQNPVMLTARQGRTRSQNRGKPLFVHECRRIAAPAEAQGRANCVTEIGRQRRAMHGNDRACLHPAKPLRVLVSEGSSTSAREAITILGLSGHHVEVCDPSPWCLARFSRFVRKFHRCPGLRDDPAGFLGLYRAAVGHRTISTCCCRPMSRDFCLRACGSGWRAASGLALPSFESYRTAHSKAGFSRLLDRLDLPQPPTRIVTSAAELRDAIRFPAVVKTSVGTASRGIWFVRDADDLEIALRDLERKRRVRRRGAGAGSDRGHDREGAIGVLPRPVARLSCLSADRRRRRRRRGDQAKREPAASARASREDRRDSSPGTARCRSITSCPTMAPRRC